MQAKERIEEQNDRVIVENGLRSLSFTEAATTSLRKPTLKKGDTGEAVEELQKLLMYWEYYYYELIDGIFSEELEWSVKAYQRKVYLEDDGIVGPLTWKALYSGAPPVPPIPVLRRGSTGKYVRMVQRTLSLHNYYDFAIDGDFGVITEVAVRKLQKDMNLTQDGIVGSRTWHALSKLYH